VVCARKSELEKVAVGNGRHPASALLHGCRLKQRGDSHESDASLHGRHVVDCLFENGGGGGGGGGVIELADAARPGPPRCVEIY
jgi:hypothetical protein